MEKEAEKYIFERVWDQFDGIYLLSHVAKQGWPDFFKVDGDVVIACKTQKIGWCTDGPGDPMEKLNYIEASIDQDSTLTLTFDGQSKQIRCNQTSVKHYYGR